MLCLTVVYYYRLFLSQFLSLHFLATQKGIRKLSPLSCGFGFYLSSVLDMQCFPQIQVFSESQFVKEHSDLVLHWKDWAKS
jgi:hypothetical protein